MLSVEQRMKCILQLVFMPREVRVLVRLLRPRRLHSLKSNTTLMVQQQQLEDRAEGGATPGPDPTALPWGKGAAGKGTLGGWG